MLEDILEVVSDHIDSRTIIAGDFNVTLKKDDRTFEREHSYDKKLLDPLVSYIDDLIFYFHTLRSFISFIKIIEEFADISGLVI